VRLTYKTLKIGISIIKIIRTFNERKENKGNIGFELVKEFVIKRTQ